MQMKTTLSPSDAAARIPDGACVLIGGFMGVGTPNRIIDAIVARDMRDLTIIANDTAMPGKGIAKLISGGCVAKVIATHIGLNPETQALMHSGKLDVELIPQGTLVERIRAAGVGLGGVLIPTGVGTEVANGKDIIEIDGAQFLLEKPLSADIALIAARQSDYAGNLEYTLTAQNFNPVMALAADEVIAEPTHIVPIGMIPPDAVRTPGVLVDYLIERPS